MDKFGFFFPHLVAHGIHEILLIVKRKQGPASTFFHFWEGGAFVFITVTVEILLM